MVHSSAYTSLDFSAATPHLRNVNVNLRAIDNVAKYFSACGQLSQINETIWAIKALQLTDLTTLAGDDTASNVKRLCIRGANPFTEYELQHLDENVKNTIHTAAVCVYPSRVHDAYEALKSMRLGDQVEIAAVATGFPSGQYSLSTRLEEIRFAIDQGATEIDIVIDRGLVLRGEWETLYNEIVEMRKVCGKNVHMKTILAIGECGNYENIYKSSMVAMIAGADFIKTSTGKESVNATLQVGLVMIRAIQDFYKLTKRKIGFKPAGGVRTLQDAIAWMSLIKSTLGAEWLQPNLFRFGASGLLDDIEKTIKTNFKQHS